MRAIKNLPYRNARAVVDAETKLAALPPALAEGRILNAPEAALFWGVSLPQWRRLYRAGKVPTPIKVSERKLGWRVGALNDALKSRERAAA